MPLFGHLWLSCSKIIKANKNSAIAAVWTAVSVMRSVRNERIILMPLFTDPPGFFVAGWRELFRCQRTVLCWMPLCSYCRISACQIVNSRDHKLSGTYRTAFSGCCSRKDCSLPLMPFLTLPPHLCMVTANHQLRCSASVFCRMPLRSDFRMRGRQIILTGQHFAVTADRTSRSIYSRFNLSFPLVTSSAFPPNLTMSAGSNLFRR